MLRLNNSIMANLILNNKNIFRAERLFSERVSSPISSSSFYKSFSDFNNEKTESVVFNKFISRLLKNTKDYRVVEL